MIRTITTTESTATTATSVPGWPVAYPNPELIPTFENPACAGTNAVDVFFPASTLHWTVRNELVEQAKSICGTCAYRAECLAFAMVRREPDGVWGGELLRDGQVIPAYPRPGRPSNAEKAARAQAQAKAAVGAPEVCFDASEVQQAA